MDVNFNSRTSKISMNGKEPVSDKGDENCSKYEEKDISDGIKGEDAIGRASFALLSKKNNPQKVTYVSTDEAKKRLSDLGIFDTNISYIISKTGNENGIDSSLINLAEKIFCEKQVKFGKDYERETNGISIPKDKYVTAEKNRSFKSILDYCYKKDGTTNFDEVCNIIDYLGQGENKRYIDDIMLYLTYGKDSNGDTKLDCVKKIKSIIQPKTNDDLKWTDYKPIVNMLCKFEQFDDILKRADKDLYDYAGYNKVLDSIESPEQIHIINKILDSVDGDNNKQAKQSFIDAPTEYLKYLTNSEESLHDMKPSELPKLTYDSKTLQELNSIYEYKDNYGCTCKGFRVTRDNKNAVKTLIKDGYTAYDIKMILTDSNKDFCDFLVDLLNGKKTKEKTDSLSLGSLKIAYEDNANLVKELANFKIKGKKGESKYFRPDDISYVYPSYKFHKEEFLDLINMTDSTGATRFTPSECVSLLDDRSKPGFEEVLNSSVEVNGKKKYLLSKNGIESCLRSKKAKSLLMNPSIQNILKFLPDGSVDRIRPGKYFDGVYTVDSRNGNEDIKVELYMDRENNAHL